MNKSLILITIVSISSGIIIGTSIDYSHVFGTSDDVKTITSIHLIQWHSLKNITLKHGQFLDLADTTPMRTIGGHVAMYIPCDNSGNPSVQFLQGIVDTDKNTLSPVEPEYIKYLSNPGSSCLYHFDIGTNQGVTDFAILNDGNNPVSFKDVNTITFSIEEIK
ncbi:MAG: hypothetical protein KGH95_01920 [Thaumarchaeota archaeon]|nr:hypothetical protein [Nitrososphaerota archaeon]